MVGDDLSLENWPLFAIRLTVNDVSLRPLAEADLGALVAILPDDAEHDPSSVMLNGLDLAWNRRRLFMQSYWRSWGCWSIDDWFIHFVVMNRGRVVGIQTLEAAHFPELRVVDGSSWLVADARGQGIGRTMRTAVLALAFDHLGADAAVSSARLDNGRSLGVSRALGYVDNGISVSRSPSGPCTLQHVILRRDAWVASGLGAGVTMSGLDGCAPWFGATPLVMIEPAESISPG